VCRVLIDQDKAIRIFHQDIKLVEDTDDLELLLMIAVASDCGSGENFIWRDSSAGVNDPGYSWTKMR